MNREKDPKVLFGIEIRKKLLELGMSQKELANQIGASENYIWHITHGRRKGTKYISQITEILKLDDF
ncbi:MAG: Helix-turn-helix domain [Clostridia bacterium]|jgi:transcriptional regulator with XRE-family HTH domain|nr:Helix-turn-helix domain [Clostridia bacterium]